jgi:hypothetical protein
VRRTKRLLHHGSLFERRKRQLRPYALAVGIYPIVVGGILLSVLAIWVMVGVL